MTELQVFNYEGNSIRTAELNGEPALVLKDVCAILEIGNARDVAARLDEDEKGVDTIDTLGGKQEMLVVNESGLYNVVLLSRKPEAKKFKRWVTHEVLPSIRKHGAYMTPDTLAQALADPRAMAGILTALAEEQERSKALLAQVETDRPKVIFSEAVSTSQNSILIGDLAKLLKQNGVETGQKRLFAWMRENGYLMKPGTSSENMPTQRAMEMGLFEVMERVIGEGTGKTFTRPTTKVTGKGQVYFIQKFLASPAVAN